MSLKHNLLQVLSRKFTNRSILNDSITPVDLVYEMYPNPQPESPSIPIILIHGLCGSKSNLRTISKHLNKLKIPPCTTLNVDVRNHGESPHTPEHTYYHLIKDIDKMMGKLRYAKASFLGHSMGGKIAMLFALVYPKRVDKLIIGDISPFSGTTKEASSVYKILLKMNDIVLPQNVSKTTALTVVDSQLSEHFHEKSTRLFFLSNLIEKPAGSFVWRINLAALIKNYESISKFPDVSGLLFEEPVLFVAGELSEYLPKKDYPDILKLFPKAQFEEIKGAGHLLHFEKPEEFQNICLEYLNRTS